MWRASGKPSVKNATASATYPQTAGTSIRFSTRIRREAGKLYTRFKGGFLDDVFKFDPEFFGISPREAECVDPQQRLLLELTWEALEDAGVPPQHLAGRPVGVFVGMFMHDFENVVSGVSERPLSSPHSATGSSTTIAANRISYFYNFQGPSLVVDTACSSSLVAVHLACKSLLDGESEVALAGGVDDIAPGNDHVPVPGIVPFTRRILQEL